MMLKFFPQGTTLYLLSLVILLHVTFSNSQSDTIVVWSQESHQWTRLRGIYGDPRQWVPSLETTFVGSIPIKYKRWTSVAHDPASGYLYWVDRKAGSTIYRQRVDLSLIHGDTKPQVILTKPDFEITGLAVDWNTGAVYFSEANYKFIGVTGATGNNKDDVYRIVANGNISNPIGVQVIPEWRRVYWMDSVKKTIEFSELDGRHREKYNIDAGDIGEPLCMTLDYGTKALYWASRDVDKVKIKWIELNSATPAVQELFSIGKYDLNSIASYQNYIYTLNSTLFKLDVYLKDKNTVTPARQYIIDATANDITIVQTKQPSFSECEKLQCDQICVNVDNSGGTYHSVCECGIGYVLETDARRCAEAESNPRYIYSHGESIWSAEVSVSYLPDKRLNMTENVILQDFKEVRALAVHVKKNLVYLNDIADGVLYRSTAQGQDLLEITVNTRRVEGMSMDWLGNQLYWADFNLGHIMCSQLDGRYHKIVLNRTDNIGRPTALAVDSAHGKLYFVSQTENMLLGSIPSNSPVIITANLDGSDLKVLLSQELFEPRGISVDARTFRLYWVDRQHQVISSIRLDGTARRDVMRTGVSNLFGTSLFQEFVTWTEETGKDIKFGDTTSGVDLNVKNSDKDVSVTYDIETFHIYAQPDVPNLCADNNGGCNQLCFHVSAVQNLMPNTSIQKQCGCAIGFYLQNDTECVSNYMLANFVLFVDPYHKQVYEVPTYGEGPRHPRGVKLPRMNHPTLVTVNAKTGEFFWLDVNQIRAAKINDKEAKIVWEIPNGCKVERMVIDEKGKYLYYTDSLRGVIGTMKVSGEDHLDLLNGLSQPSGLAIQHNKLFWTERGSSPKVAMMNVDSKQVTVLNSKDVVSPLAITIPETDTGMVYWSDESGVFSFNLTSQETTQIFKEQNSKIIAIATHGDGVYFTRWDEKGIYLVNDTQGLSQATQITEEIFARITDLRVIRVMAGPVTGYFPVVPVAAGIAAGFLFLLLLALLLLLACIRKPKKQPPAGMETGFDDPNLQQDYINVFNGTANGTANGVSNGHVDPPVPVVSEPPPVAPETDLYVNTRPKSIHPPDGLAGLPVVLPVVAAAPRKFKKPNELPAAAADPTFELEREKVATRIQRLANRLRNRLSTIRWSGGPFGQDNLVPDQPSETPDAVPYTKNNEKKPVDYKPQLHRLPRGFAPASHSVPVPVKNTWGRNKMALMMKGEVPPQQ